MSNRELFVTLKANANLDPTVNAWVEVYTTYHEETVYSSALMTLVDAGALKDILERMWSQGRSDGVSDARDVLDNLAQGNY